jgi:hypothetical protein
VAGKQQQRGRWQRGWQSSNGNKCDGNGNGNGNDNNVGDGDVALPREKEIMQEECYRSRMKVVGLKIVRLVQVQALCYFGGLLKCHGS